MCCVPTWAPAVEPPSIIMTKNTPLHQSEQNDKRNLPHRGGHTYTKSKNTLRRNRHHQSNHPPQSKNLKFVSKTVPSTVVEEVIYKKLDPKIPEQAKRLQSRRRMISYGKVRSGEARGHEIDHRDCRPLPNCIVLTYVTFFSF